MGTSTADGFSLALFFSKAIAEPTFVQSKSIDDAFYLGLNFNNDVKYCINIQYKSIL